MFVIEPRGRNVQPQKLRLETELLENDTKTMESRLLQLRRDMEKEKEKRKGRGYQVFNPSHVP